MLESDVGLQTLQSFFQLDSEFLKDRVELFLLLVFADAPSGVVEAVDEWLVDLVDDGVERGDHVLRDLTEQDLIVGGGVQVHCPTCRRGTEEVHTFALELDLLAVSHEELFMTAEILDFTRLRDLVLGLVVDEDSRGTLALEKIINLWLSIASEDFLGVILSNLENVGDNGGHPFRLCRHCHCFVVIFQINFIFLNLQKIIDSN